MACVLDGNGVSRDGRQTLLRPLNSILFNPGSNCSLCQPKWIQLLAVCETNSPFRAQCNKIIDLQKLKMLTKDSNVAEASGLRTPVKTKEKDTSRAAWHSSPSLLYPSLNCKVKKNSGYERNKIIVLPFFPLIYTYIYTHTTIVMRRWDYLSQADTTALHCGAELHFPQKISKSSFIFFNGFVMHFSFCVSLF